MVLSRIPLVGRLHPVIRAIVVLILATLVYLVVTGVQVWLTSRQYSPQRASAIVVMGAAQYNGTPSPDLQSRLNEALILYRDDLAPLVVVTGYKEKGDRFTEAEAGGMYLERHDVPSSAIVEVGGTDSYENLADAATLLKARGISTVLIDARSTWFRSSHDRRAISASCLRRTTAIVFLPRHRWHLYFIGFLVLGLAARFIVDRLRGVLATVPPSPSVE